MCSTCHPPPQGFHATERAGALGLDWDLVRLCIGSGGLWSLLYAPPVAVADGLPPAASALNTSLKWPKVLGITPIYQISRRRGASLVMSAGAVLGSESRDMTTGSRESPRLSFGAPDYLILRLVWLVSNSTF